MIAFVDTQCLNCGWTAENISTDDAPAMAEIALGCNDCNAKGDDWRITPSAKTPCANCKTPTAGVYCEYCLTFEAKPAYA